MVPVFRCYADPRPGLPGGRIVEAIDLGRELTSPRYVFLLAAEAETRTEAGLDWLTGAKWHDATDFRTAHDSLLFRVPAGVANGLVRGRRYVIAIADAVSKEMVRGEILWEDQPPLLAGGISRYESQVATESVPEEPPDPQRRKGQQRTSKWGVLLVAFVAVCAIGLWIALPERRSAGTDQGSLAKTEANRPPIAGTFSMDAVAGESLLVDTRKYARDPDGAAPRLLELEPAQFGTVEGVDDFRFRYSAPPQEREMDVFLYRVVDDSGATSEGWVFVNVKANRRSQPGFGASTPRARDQDSRRPSEPPGSDLETRRIANSETTVEPTKDQDQPAVAAPPQLAVVTPLPAPAPKSAPESVPESSPERAPALVLTPTAEQKPAPKPESRSILEQAAATQATTPVRSGELRGLIADALDAEDLDLVRSLCNEAMVASASLAKFCGIVFDPNKRLFDAHPDASFALACYDQASRLGDTEAGDLAAAVRPFVQPAP